MSLPRGTEEKRALSRAARGHCTWGGQHGFGQDPPLVCIYTTGGWAGTCSALQAQGLSEMNPRACVLWVLPSLTFMHGAFRAL